MTVSQPDRQKADVPAEPKGSPNRSLVSEEVEAQQKVKEEFAEKEQDLAHAKESADNGPSRS